MSEDLQPSTTTVSAPATYKVRRATIAASLGHLVELYDLSVYGYVATVMAPLFFPSTDSATSVLSMLAVFGTAFVARPIGGYLFGRFADRRGRRPALIGSILMMGISSFLVGVLPTHAQIGIAAPFLLFLLRIVQGISAGGETGDVTTFIREWAPRDRKGFYLSFIPAAGNFGKAAAAGAAALMGALLPPDGLAGWGWRIPFLVILPLTLICLYMRLSVEDSPAFTKLKRAGQTAQAPLRDLWNDYRPQFGKLLALMLVQGMASYVGSIYIGIYFTAVLGFSTEFSGLIVLIATTLAAVAIFGVGMAADKWGRMRILAVSYVLYAVLSYPMYLIMGIGKQWALIGLIVMMIPYVLILVGSYAVYSELLPVRVRATGVTVGYALATALTGGLGPYVTTWLIDRTGDQLMPAYLLLASGLLGLVAMTRIKRTPAGQENEYR